MAKTQKNPTKTSVKLQNKQSNKNKRGSYRIEKDARRSKRAEENASQITTYIGGEAVQISSQSKHGKKILAKMKKRKAEAKSDRRYAQRHALVSQDNVREVLQGKRTGVTMEQLKDKLEAEKSQLKNIGIKGSKMGDSDDDDDDDDNDGGQNQNNKSNQSKPLTAAQREIQEMMERSKKAREIEAKILKLQNGEDLSDMEDEQVEEEENLPKKKVKKMTAKEIKKQKQEEWRRKNKDYEDEEELNFIPGDDNDNDLSDGSIDYDDDGDDDDDNDDEYEIYEEEEDQDDEDDSDYEIKQQYRDQHKTFIKTTKATGTKQDVRSAMLSTLYDDLPQYKPMPTKMASLLKSQGKNIKEVEAQRKSDHDLKIKKILAEREKKIREYDSDDDDDSDRDEDEEDEAEYFLRKMAEQQERRKDRKAQKNASRSDNDEDDQSEDEKILNLVQVKAQNQSQRAAQKQQLKELWLAQKSQRDEVATPTIPSQQLQKTTPKSSVGISAVEGLKNKDEVLRKKEEMKKINQKKQETSEMSNHRLMVLLDDGTWGYRDSDVAVVVDQGEAGKPDLSAYVRQPKKSKKELKAEERAAQEALEPDPLDDGKTSDALKRFEAFMAQGKDTQTKPDKMAQKIAKLNQHNSQVQSGQIDSDNEYGFDDNEFNNDTDFDEDMEFESDNGDDFVDPAYRRSQMHDGDTDDEEDEMAQLTSLTKRKMKKHLAELEQFHDRRLDRIRQVQLILGQLCTELLENPHKYIVGGHLEALLKLCNDKDQTVQQLTIASTATVFADILPSYRIKYHNSTTHAGVNNSTRLTKDVRIMRTYENALLDHYKDFLTILHKFVHRGLSLFYAKQRVLWNQFNADKLKNESSKIPGTTPSTKNETNPYEEYSKINIDLAEKQSTLYSVALKSTCQVFSKGYAFNFNTQVGSLLAHVLTSDYLEWSDMATACISEVFKQDKCSEATHEIVQTIADVCKKRAGEKIRAPLLSVLLEIPFSYQVIHYKDPNQAKKDLKAKQDAKRAKDQGRIKGVTGAGHHYAEKMKQHQEKTMKQMKKALRSGKEYQGPDPNSTHGKSVHDLQLEVQREMKESEAVLGITERQKLQTKSLSLVFTIFFRYLKQAPTIKTLYNYNTVNVEHQQQYDLLKQSFTAQSTVHKTAELLSIPKEHRNQVILTQTMLGIVTPPTHFVLAIILKGIMKFGPLINVELVLDLLAHLLLVIQTATALESLPLSSSLLALECIFTLLQMHGSAIDIDLAPHYQVLYNIIWQLTYNPEYTFLLIKCIDLSIIHRKHLSYRRVAAIVRRVFQVSLHLQPQYSLPLLQIASQCLTAHPTIGSIFDNDKMQSGLYDMGHPQPDTSDAIGTPAWEALAQAQAVHPYASNITLHTLLSDLRLGTNTNTDGKEVGNSVDRSQLSISLTTLELPNEINKLERPQRITRQIAVSRLKPLELYSAIDISKGGFCPDVEAPDAKKLRKLMHYEWYDRYNWLAQVEQMKDNDMYNHFDTSYQSRLMNDIMGGEHTVASFLETPIVYERYQ